jgi:signal transduction histidine kinase
VRGRRHAGGSPQGFLLAGLDVSDLVSDASGQERGLRDASAATERLRTELDEARTKQAAAEARERDAVRALDDARQEGERLQREAQDADQALEAARRDYEALQRGHGDTTAALATVQREHEALAQRQRAAAAALEKARLELEAHRQRERDAVDALEAARQDLDVLATERRQSATQARLLDTLPGMAAWVRADGRLGWSNRAWQATFGAAASFGDALGADRLAELEPRMRAALGGEAVSFSCVLPVGGQPRQLEASFIPQQEDGRPAGFVAAFHDLTASREAEARLFQARKMEAIGQLTGGVAHELGNALGVVTGNLQVLEHELAADPGARRRLKTALDAAARGADVTRRLLAFSRQQDLDPEVVAINDFLSRHAPLFERSLGKGAALELALDDAAWPVRVDPAQLETALLHLVANAAEAIEGSGRVTLATANRTLDTDAARRLLGPSATAGDFLELSVSDTGRGISEELLGRVFDPFFTTKAAGRAAGLGLSMVWGFAQQSGGRATLESRPGDGTRATLWLPRHRGAGRQADPAALAEAAPPPAPTALVVEPDAAMRETAVAMLELLGWRAVAAEDASAALAYLADRPADLLFTELAPGGGLDGAALARRAQARRPALRVLFATAYGVLEGDMRHPVIDKPYRREDLERALRELAGGERTRG